MRLIVADDDLLVREGLRRVLAALCHDVVAAVARAEQVLSAVQRHRPDVVVLDIRMPPTYTDEGLRLASAIRSRYPTVGVLVLSQYVEASYATQLLTAGGGRVGYLLKDSVCEPAVLDDAVTRLADGGTVVEPRIVAELMARVQADDPLDTLTSRERDVLASMAQGLSDHGIAGRLHITPATVSTHIQNVFRKLQISDEPCDNRRVNAVLAYLRRTTGTAIGSAAPGDRQRSPRGGGASRSEGQRTHDPSGIW